jgi:hypothetical protein
MGRMHQKDRYTAVAEPGKPPEIEYFTQPGGERYAKVPLSNGGYALIDEDDICRVDERIWFSVKDGSRFKTIKYAATSEVVNGKSKTIMMHRLLMGLSRRDGIKVDHKNHDGLDNRRENLRTCSDSQNIVNQRKRASTLSQFKGVTKIKDLRRIRTPWQAQISKKIGGISKSISLGCYESEGEAAFAYSVAAPLLHDPHYLCLKEIPLDLMPSLERQQEIRSFVLDKIKAFLSGRNKLNIGTLSCYRGVIFSKRVGKWWMVLQKNKKKFTFLCRTEHEAAFAYNTASLCLGGKGVRLNNIDPENLPTSDRCIEIETSIKKIVEERLAGVYRNIPMLEVTAFGETKCMTAWSKDSRCKVSIVGLSQRLKSGMTAEEAITRESDRSKSNLDKLLHKSYRKNETEVVRLFVDELWTMRRIAIYFDTNHHSIRRVLKRHGVTVSVGRGRPRSNVRHCGGRSCPKFDEIEESRNFESQPK